MLHQSWPDYLQSPCRCHHSETKDPRRGRARRPGCAELMVHSAENVPIAVVERAETVRNTDHLVAADRIAGVSTDSTVTFEFVLRITATASEGQSSDRPR